MAMLDLKIPPLVLWAAFAASTVTAAYWFPAANVMFAGHQALATVVALVGAAIAIAGVLAFRRAKTTVNPLTPEKASSVVITGIFRYTRNPMYLGMAAGLLAIALWWSTPFGLLFLAAFCIYITRFQIQPEERALREHFGEDFNAYMLQVRRWI